MRATGDGGEVSAAAEKQHRMIPRCNVCSPLQPHISHPPRLIFLAVLAWVIVCSFCRPGEGPVDLVLCTGEQGAGDVLRAQRERTGERTRP
eukprot:3752406-Prymnesium_polylepis.1